MVNNLFEINNGFENGSPILQKLNIKEYKMVKLKYYDYCKKVINSWNETKIEILFDDELNEIKSEIRNTDYIIPNDKMLKFREKYFKNSSFGIGWIWAEVCYDDMEWQIENGFKKHFTFQEILDYLGIIPFTPSVMINISPDWNSVKCCQSTTHRIKHLKYLIENYMSESQRYDKYSYVIENGSEGKHIHAHIVAHINPKLIASVLDGKNSHIRKGRQTPQITKWNDKVKGMKGIIKGQSVQVSILRTEEIVNDKLDYLVENLKPEGHKNKSVIKPGRVDVVLFTVKY